MRYRTDTTKLHPLFSGRLNTYWSDVYYRDQPTRPFDIGDDDDLDNDYD